MKGFDYASDNLYFVTICVQDRKCCFGNIDLIGTGYDLSVHNSNPNDANYNNQNSPVNNQKMILNEFGKIARQQWLWLQNQYDYADVHTFIIMPNHVHAIIEINSEKAIKDQKIKSLSQLVGAYKTTSSKLIHLAGFKEFSWQRSFHDHIIRTDTSYQRIYEYIKTNPERWDNDSFFTTN